MKKLIIASLFGVLFLGLAHSAIAGNTSVRHTPSSKPGGLDGRWTVMNNGMPMKGFDSETAAIDYAKKVASETGGQYNGNSGGIDKNNGGTGSGSGGTSGSDSGGSSGSSGDKNFSK